MFAALSIAGCSAEVGNPVRLPIEDGSLGGHLPEGLTEVAPGDGYSIEVSGLEDLVVEPPLVDKANGTLIFHSSCTSAQRTKLQQAMNLVQAALSNGSLRSCLANAFLAYSGLVDPETITYWLAQDLPTTIRCDGMAAGHVEPEDFGVLTRERMAISPSTLNRSVADIAGTIAHELTHTKGWAHPSPATGSFDHDFTIPYVVGNCMTGIALGDTSPFHPHPTPDGQGGRILTKRNRALLPAESYTAPVGNKMTGSSIFDLRCSSGYAYIMALGAPSPSPRGIALGCSGGDALYLGSFGSNAGTAACGQNEALVGIAGLSPPHGLPASVLGLCAPLTSVLNGQLTISRIISPYPVNGSLNYTRLCPAGMVVDGVSGRASSTTLGDISLHCHHVFANPTRGERRLAAVGATPSNVTSILNDLVKCAGRSALRGFVGMNSGSTIYGFGGMCVNIDALSDRARVRPEASPWREYYLAPTVGDDRADVRFNAQAPSNTSARQCAADQALIGANIRASGRVTFVQGVCANVEQWTNASQPAPAQTTLEGFGSSTTGTLSQLRCNRGELLVGAEVRHSVRNSDGGRTIDRIQPICRDFRWR